MCSKKRKYIFMFRCSLLLLAPFLCNALTQAVVVTPAAETLKKAWQEYGFQTFSAAEKLFHKVETATDSTEDDILQAQIGLAFIKQYRLPGRNPEEAVGMYKHILTKLKSTDKYYPLVMSRLGGCYAEKEEPNFEEARKCYKAVLDLDLPATSPVLQDTLMRYATSYLKRPVEADLRKALEIFSQYAKRFEKTNIASSIYGYSAKVAFLLHDLHRYEQELVKQIDAGIQNPNALSAAIITVARLNDKEFKNYKKAIEYYDMFTKKLPFSHKSYYAKLRRDELKKGIYVSRIPPRKTNLKAVNSGEKK